MIGRRAVVGLSLLSALLFCVFAAQSASAALTTSKNTTAFTCVKTLDNSGDFTKAHCDKEDTGVLGKEVYKHELIPLKTTTEVDATNDKVTESTTKSEPAVLKGTVNLVKTEITCNTVKNNTKESTIHNEEPEAGSHTFTGTVVVEYTNCTVSKPEKCTVKTPIVATATVHGVEGLEGPKGEKNAMGVEFVGHGVEETFTEITYQGESCALKNQTFPVKGKVIATNGPTTESSQENREAGATLVFTPKFKMQELKLGKEAAEFTSIVTPKMAGETGNPISLTTTTP
jgi:hypothetical protein